MQINQKKAYFYAVLSVCFWSTVATAFKFALSELNFSEVLFYSSFFSFLVFVVVLSAQGRFLKLFQSGLKAWIWSALMGFLNPFLYYLILFKAYSLLPAQEALTLNYVWAIMLVIFSIVLLKQKISLFRFLALFISFSGVIVIASHGNLSEFKFSNSFGVALALLSSIVWAFYWILNIKDNREEVIKLGHNFLFGFIYSAIYIIFFGGITMSLIGRDYFN